jgi:hypothetical protein
MKNPSDDDERLTILLQAISTPEPSPSLLTGARRRYREALDARYRREVFLGLVAASVGLLLPAILLLSLFEPAALIAWGAVGAAGVTRWMAGAAIVVSIVPLAVWISVVVGVVVSLFPIALLAHVRRLAVVK